MTRRPEIFDFTVRGARSLPFPLDQLRFAQCWPASAGDVSLIERSLIAAVGAVESVKSLIAEEQLTGARNIEVRLQTSHDPRGVAFHEYAKRWASFGWYVQAGAGCVAEDFRVGATA